MHESQLGVTKVVYLVKNGGKSPDVSIHLHIYHAMGNSSPELKVLKVSYCDRPLSVIRCQLLL